MNSHSTASIWAVCFASLFTLASSGCSVLTDATTSKSDQEAIKSQVKSLTDSDKGQVANPPARTIRFDGHEIVLGQAEAAELSADKLYSMLSPLVTQNRTRTASSLINYHRETAERLMAERWATAHDDAVIRLTAQVLSRRSNQAEASWLSLLKVARDRPLAARPYQQARNAFAQLLQTADPTNEQAAQLQQLAQNLNHPLAKVDCLRLLGLRELVAGRNAWAEALCRQAVDTAYNSGNVLLAAEMSLMVGEAARRSDQMPLANQAWNAAVATHIANMRADQPIDVAFWLMADNCRPENTPWPNELISAVGQQLQTIGCTSDGGAEMALWACIAEAQYQRGNMQSALVNFKRAEAATSGNNTMWLRIAQSRCLAALGQGPAAAAILSGPASSTEPAIAAAATAAMGSTKLQAGAYQQGAQLLNKAITESAGATWPTKTQAMADLALAQLIIGDTDPGLEALHAVQTQLIQTGDNLMLIRALDNEMSLLQHEGRTDEAAQIKQRIVELEKL